MCLRSPILALGLAVMVFLVAVPAHAGCERFGWSVRSPAPVLVIKRSAVNVRAGPGTAHPVVGTVRSTRVSMYAEQRCSAWAEVVVEHDRRDTSPQLSGWVYLPLTCTPRWAARSREGNTLIAPACPSP